MPNIAANGIAIEYDCFGDPDKPAFLLISGLGTQMIRWSACFCQLLAEKGYYVVRFDNRDTGLSTHLDGAPMDDLATIAAAAARGEAPAVPYTLADMAKDAVGLLDALQIARAHVAGRSMGGTIAQLVASEYPDRVASLASLMSSSGNPLLPQARPDAMAAMTSPTPHPVEDREGYLDHRVAFSRLIAGRGYPFDASAQRAQALAELERAYRPGGLVRQISAIAATGDLRKRLGKIRAPTLVIHGTDDPLVSPQAGKDVADHIQGARLLLVEGMGHDLPAALFPLVVDAISQNASRATVLVTLDSSPSTDSCM